MAYISWDYLAEELTEQDWLEATDPDLALWFLTTEAHLSKRKLRSSNRKLRLFGVACCRRIWSLLSEEWARESVLIAEAYADGLAGDLDLKVAFSMAPESLLGLGGWHVHRVPEAAAAAGEDRSVWGLVAARDVSAPDGGADEADLPHQMRRAYCPDNRDPSELAAQAVLLRDIHGNPFRLTAFDPRWRTPDVIGISHRIYDERDIAAMPVLADALEEAGCTDADILGHLRSAGPHVRGCWVIDLILGKE